jgi:putative drug exporter of the RND superfamily
MTRTIDPTAATAAPSDVKGRYNHLGRFAIWCYDHRRRVVAAWIIALVVTTAGGAALGGTFQDKILGGNTESEHARVLLQHAFPTQAGDAAQLVFHTATSVASPANHAAIERSTSRLRSLPHVAGVRGPFDAGVVGQVSPDGHTAFAVVQFDDTADNLPKASVQRVIDVALADVHPHFAIELGGAPISKIEKAAPGASEFVGILAAIIILLFTFGSVIAMGLPILTAVFGIAIAFGVLNFVSHVLVVPTFGGELAALIGLGAGIDYALFVTTRYRQALHDDIAPRDAVAIAMATSGRAVLFAGVTVVISLFGLFLLGLTFVYGLALGAIAGVVLVLAAALSLLPAVLGFVGTSIDRLHVPRALHRGDHDDAHHTIAWRWSRVVQRRPALAGGAALLILLTLALPLLSMRLAFSDAGNDNTDFTSRRAYDLLAESFGPGTNGPLVVAVALPGGTDVGLLATLHDQLLATRGVGAVAPPRLSPHRDAAVIIVTPTSAPQDQRTQQLVERIRTHIRSSVTAGTDTHVLVGGVTAAGIDASDQYSARLPLVIGAVVLLSFLLLMAVFRSVAVPLKAVLMNLLSIGAAYGVMVAVFQWGWLSSIFNVSQTGPIDPWIPVMLFTILFGLSMDYEVFLLSRIREEWRRSHDNATAVADGLASTARLITAAAAIMVCVFGSFALSDVRALKIIGVGLATAVFVDATLVRLILVPSTMELLGRANWWLPHWLDRAVPNLAAEMDETPAPSTHRPVQVTTQEIL